MNKLLLLIGFMPIFTLSAQTIADFETTAFGATNYLDNAGATGVFAHGNIGLVNSYDAQFMAWQGWALSKVNDPITQGFGNQYACISGKGALNSQVYAVGYAYTPSVVRLTGAATGKLVQGCYINNSTYAYYTIRDGDPFSKRFGGPTGTDPDFFLLTVKGYRNNALTADSVNFYLADYRAAQSTQDYIVKDWAFVNLSSLGNVDSLSFELSSTDVGAFGMNTPAYFCMDRLTTLDGASSTTEAVQQTLAVYPNPAHDMAYITDNQLIGSDFVLHSAHGTQVRSGQVGYRGEVALAGLPTGLYVLRVGNQVAKLLHVE